MATIVINVSLASISISVASKSGFEWERAFLKGIPCLSRMAEPPPPFLLGLSQRKVVNPGIVRECLGFRWVSVRRRMSDLISATKSDSSHTILKVATEFAFRVIILLITIIKQSGHHLILVFHKAKHHSPHRLNRLGARGFRQRFSSMY